MVPERAFRTMSRCQIVALYCLLSLFKVFFLCQVDLSKKNQLKVEVTKMFSYVFLHGQSLNDTSCKSTRPDRVTF